MGNPNSWTEKGFDTQYQNSSLVTHQQTFIHQDQRMRELAHRSPVMWLEMQSSNTLQQINQMQRVYSTFLAYTFQWKSISRNVSLLSLVRVTNFYSPNIFSCTVMIFFLGNILCLMWKLDLTSLIFLKSSSSSPDFWLTCRFRDNIHISGPPSR